MLIVTCNEIDSLKDRYKLSHRERSNKKPKLYITEFIVKILLTKKKYSCKLVSLVMLPKIQIYKNNLNAKGLELPT